MRYASSQIVIAMSAFLRAQQVPIGVWAWQERDANGVLSFVWLEPRKEEADAARA